MDVCVLSLILWFIDLKAGEDLADEISYWFGAGLAISCLG